MKLSLELINTPIERKVTRQRVGRWSGTRYSRGSLSRKSKQLGSGTFASVERHDNLPPGSVIKYGTVSRDIKQDGYVNFLTQISKGDHMASNPHLPRIYKVKILDASQYVVIMEELYRLDQLDERELASIVNRMFGGIDKMAGALPSPIATNLLDADNKNPRLAIRKAIAMICHQVLSGTLSGKIMVDPPLRDAVAIMKRIIRSKAGGADLHSENVMVRRGPTGVQLVFTDPMI